MGFIRTGRRMRVRHTIFAAATAIGCALTAACSDDTSGPQGPGEPNVPQFEPLGLGEVPERYTAEVAVRDGWAYTSTWSSRLGNVGNAVKIWDVTGTAPALVDSLIVSGSTTTGDVQISADGDLLVVAGERSGSLSLYDRSNPADPQLLQRYTSEEIEPGVHTVKLGTVDDRDYAFLNINPTGSSPARLVILDITNPAAPQRVYGAAMGNPFVHDVFVRDGVLFTALWDDGVSIFDIGGAGRGGTPSSPVLLGNVRTVGGAAHNVYWFHDPVTDNKDYAIVGEEQPGPFGNSLGDIHIIDVSDMTAPREVAYFTVMSAGTHNFSVDEEKGILYAAYYEAGVVGIDIRGDLKTCTAEQRVGSRCNLTETERLIGRGLNAMPGTPVYVWGVQVEGDVLYASDMLNGLWKLDVTQ